MATIEKTERFLIWKVDPDIGVKGPRAVGFRNPMFVYTEVMCWHCDQLTTLDNQCKCEKVYFCSEKCQQAKRSAHQFACDQKKLNTERRACIWVEKTVPEPHEWEEVFTAVFKLVCTYRVPLRHVYIQSKKFWEKYAGTEQFFGSVFRTLLECLLHKDSFIYTPRVPAEKARMRIRIIRLFKLIELGLGSDEDLTNSPVVPHLNQRMLFLLMRYNVPLYISRVTSFRGWKMGLIMEEIAPRLTHLDIYTGTFWDNVLTAFLDPDTLRESAPDQDVASTLTLASTSSTTLTSTAGGFRIKDRQTDWKALRRWLGWIPLEVLAENAKFQRLELEDERLEDERVGLLFAQLTIDRHKILNDVVAYLETLNWPRDIAHICISFLLSSPDALTACFAERQKARNNRHRWGTPMFQRGGTLAEQYAEGISARVHGMEDAE